MRGGRETLASIENALHDIKADELALQRELEDANRDRAELTAKRLDALRDLATLRAHDAAADGVIDEADELSGQVRGILQARTKTISQLEERQQNAEAAREKHVRLLDALNATIAALEEKLDVLGARARTALKDDPDYKAIAENHAALALMHEKATNKADQVARDEHEKGAPYRGDTLFMYLWNRQYGTAAYRATGLIRYLDDWVAGLVRYRDARANYAVLTEITIRLKAHGEDLAGQVAAESARLSEIEAAKTRELAGGDLVADLKRAREEQSRNNKELDAMASELTETGGQLRLYAKGEDRSFQDAVRSLAEFLERKNLVALVSEAANTQTPEDDSIVSTIGKLRRQIEAVETRNETRRHRLDQLFEKKQELTRLSGNFRRRHYEDIGSEFDDSPDLEELLQSLLRGAITAAEYWARTRAQQRWRDRPGDPWRRSSGLPPFGNGPGDWNWGGRGSRPSGGGSGGAFETGGSF